MMCNFLYAIVRVFVWLRLGRRLLRYPWGLRTWRLYLILQCRTFMLRWFGGWVHKGHHQLARRSIFPEVLHVLRLLRMRWLKWVPSWRLQLPCYRKSCSRCRNLRIPRWGSRHHSIGGVRCYHWRRWMCLGRLPLSRMHWWGNSIGMIGLWLKGQSQIQTI